MNEVWSKIVNLIAVIVVFGTSMVQFSYSKPLEHLPSSTKDRIIKFIQGFDENAVVQFDFAEKKINRKKLPGIVISVDQKSLQKNHRKSIDRISIRISTKLKILPNRAQNYIENILEDYTNNVEFTYEKPIEGYQDPDVRENQQRLKSDSQNFQLAINELANIGKVFQEKFPELSGINFKKLSNDWNNSEFRKYLRWILLGFIVIIGAVTLSCFYSLFSSSHYRRQLILSINNAQQQISNSLLNKSVIQRSPDQTFSSESPVSASTLNGSEMMSSSTLDDLTCDSVLALIADCYWSENDKYASFVWRQISIQKRRDLLRKQPYIYKYADYLLSVSPVNLGFEHDPAYIDPLPIEHLGMEELTEVIRKMPHLLSKLSRLRQDALTLSIIEKIQLPQIIAQEDSRTSDFPNIPPSVLRKLPNFINIHIKTIEDEEALLAVEDISIERMTAVQSLVWSMRLNTDDLKEILQPITAVDLASAWIAPKSVLERFEQCIPEQKLVLLNSYLTKMPPSRQSQTYIYLHNIIVDKLRKKVTYGNDVQSGNKIMKLSNVG